MMRALILTAVLSVGCGGYQCEGPACPGDAAVDAGVDGGAAFRCFGNCPGSCCDNRTGSCITTVRDDACMPKDITGRDSCVACDVAGGELCGPTATEGTGYNARGLQYQCVKRASRCAATCLDCCDEATGQCQRGDNEAHCGRAGGACRDCGAGMRCAPDSRGGVCVTNP